MPHQRMGGSLSHEGKISLAFFFFTSPPIGPRGGLWAPVPTYTKPRQLPFLKAFLLTPHRPQPFLGGTGRLWGTLSIHVELS